MQHPVFVAFYMRHLDLDDQRTVRRWSIRLAVVCASLALLLLAIVAVRVYDPASQTDAMKREGSTAYAQRAHHRNG